MQPSSDGVRSVEVWVHIERIVEAVELAEGVAASRTVGREREEDLDAPIILDQGGVSLELQFNETVSY